MECYYCNAEIPENSLRCPHCGKFFSAAKKLAAFAVVIIIVAAGLGFLVYNEFIGSHLAYENGTIIDEQDGNDNGNDDENPNEGLDLAPDFTLPKVGGGTLQLSNLRGKVVVLDFMATWCEPCETEIGHLKVVDGAYSDSQVEIISVDVDAGESDSLLSSYAAEKGVTWPIVRDTLGISRAPGYEAERIPTLVIVNQDGYIQYWNEGVISSSELESIIDGLLG